MRCRRCQKELPEGHGGSCPYCGTRLDTFIVPRGTQPKQKKKTSRAQMLSLLSVALVVVIVCILIPVLREQNKRVALSEIQEIFDRGDVDEVEVLSAKIASFEKSYPSDKEEHARLQKMLNEFLGLDENFDPASPTPPPDSGEARQKEIDRLIAEARTTIFDAVSLTLSGPTYEDAYGITLKWHNLSKKTVSELIVTVEAFDASGKPVDCAKRGKSEGYLRMAELSAGGAEPTGIFLGVWFAEEITEVRIKNVQISYADGTKAYLPEEVCSVLWDGFQ